MDLKGYKVLRIIAIYLWLHKSRHHNITTESRCYY
jgi:hypothetical protein